MIITLEDLDSRSVELSRLRAMRSRYKEREDCGMFLTRVRMLRRTGAWMKAKRYWFDIVSTATQLVELNFSRHREIGDVNRMTDPLVRLHAAGGPMYTPVSKAG